MTILFGRSISAPLARTVHVYRSANRAHIPLWRLTPNDDLSAPNSSHSLALDIYTCSLAGSASDRCARRVTLAPREPGNPNAFLACHRWVVCDDDDRVPRDCKNKRPRADAHGPYSSYRVCRKKRDCRGRNVFERSPRVFFFALSYRNSIEILYGKTNDPNYQNRRFSSLLIFITFFLHFCLLFVLFLPSL